MSDREFITFQHLWQKDKGVVPLKEQLAAVIPVLENLKCKKEERVKQFSDIRSQIEKIRFELSEHNDQGGNVSSLAAEEHDLSTRKLNSYQAQLRALQKDKVYILNLPVFFSEDFFLNVFFPEDFGISIANCMTSG